ncbi:hypothetical protein Psm1vBMR14_gp59 [Pseudomonas phage MR14]|nr:hypothetical protein Psm1vBMR14_gp59 [Pseudomonas phage MR14]
MKKLPPATLDDVCESLDRLAKKVSDGLIYGSPLEGIAMCLGMTAYGPSSTVQEEIRELTSEVSRAADNLERIASALESR